MPRGDVIFEWKRKAGFGRKRRQPEALSLRPGLTSPCLFSPVTTISQEALIPEETARLWLTSGKEPFPRGKKGSYSDNLGLKWLHPHFLLQTPLVPPGFRHSHSSLVCNSEMLQSQIHCHLSEVMWRKFKVIAGILFFASFTTYYYTKPSPMSLLTVYLNKTTGIHLVQAIPPFLDGRT